MKKLFFIFIVFVIFIIFLILVLEILSKNYQCQKTLPSPHPCYSGPLPEEYSELEMARQKRLVGEKISRQEYRQLDEKFIFEVSPEKLDGFYNGIACGSYGYIRNDLPKEAKKFVKRHELEHLLQTSKEQNPEFYATLATAKEYPFGFLQTTFFTLENRAKYSESSACYIISLWKTFKIYMLP